MPGLAERRRVRPASSRSRPCGAGSCRSARCAPCAPTRSASCAASWCGPSRPSCSCIRAPSASRARAPASSATSRARRPATSPSSDVAFHALREYQPGDERRYIHWKSTAKTGTFMVRQFEETRRSHLVVALTLATGDYASEEEFELAVSVAGSLGVRAIRDGRTVSVVVSDASPPSSPSARCYAVRAARHASSRPACSTTSPSSTSPAAALNIRDVARVAADDVDGISVAFLVCGSRTDGRRAARRLALVPARRRGGRDRLRPGGRARPAPRRRPQRAHHRLPRRPARRARPDGGRRMSTVRARHDRPRPSAGSSSSTRCCSGRRRRSPRSRSGRSTRHPQFIIARRGHDRARHRSSPSSGRCSAGRRSSSSWSAFAVLPAGGRPARRARIRRSRASCRASTASVDLLAGVALGWKQLLTIALPVGDYQALLVPAFVLVLTSTIVALSVALRARWGELGVLAAHRAVRRRDRLRAGDRAVAGRRVPLAHARRRAALADLAALARASRVDPLARRARPIWPAPSRASTSGFGCAHAARAAVCSSRVAAAASIGAASALAADRAIATCCARRSSSPSTRATTRARSPGSASTCATTACATRVLHRDGPARRQPHPDRDPRQLRRRRLRGRQRRRSTAHRERFVRIPSGVDQSADGGHLGRGRGRDRRTTTASGCPRSGSFERVDFGGDRAGRLRDAFYYNDTSGTAAVIGGLGAGDSYTLDAVLPSQPTQAQLGDADAGVGRRAAASATCPDELALDARRLRAGHRRSGRAPGRGARRPQGGGLHQPRPRPEDEPPSRSGHAADRITELLTAPAHDRRRRAVRRRRRAHGASARLPGAGRVRIRAARTRPDRSTCAATTSRPGSRSTPRSTAGSRSTRCPRSGRSPRRSPRTRPRSPARSRSCRRLRTAPTPTRSSRRPTASADEPDAIDPVLLAILGVLRVAGLVLAIAGVLMAPFLFVIAAKIRRRRLRRTRPTPLQRIRGGWDEFADTVVDHGYSPAGRRDPLRARRRRRHPSRPACWPRWPTAPSSRPAIPQPDDADHVWDAVGELRAVLDGNVNRRQRVKALISLRSLGGYSVRNLIKGARR